MCIDFFVRFEWDIDNEPLIDFTYCETTMQRGALPAAAGFRHTIKIKIKQLQCEYAVIAATLTNDVSAMLLRSRWPLNTADVRDITHLKANSNSKQILKKLCKYKWKIPLASQSSMFTHKQTSINSIYHMKHTIVLERNISDAYTFIHRCCVLFSALAGALRLLWWWRTNKQPFRMNWL